MVARPLQQGHKDVRPFLRSQPVENSDNRVDVWDRRRAVVKEVILQESRVP